MMWQKSKGEKKKVEPVTLYELTKFKRCTIVLERFGKTPHIINDQLHCGENHKRMLS